jgi:hypothetical protein
MWVFFWSMQLAMWTNGMAYAVSEFARAVFIDPSLKEPRKRA